MTEVVDEALVPLPVGGKLELSSYVGSDLDFVRAARVSFDGDSTEYGATEDGILAFLLRNRHATPLEHGQLTFYVELPIFVVREWMRHRTWSFNELSGRYSELERKFFIPRTEDMRIQVGRPGHYKYEQMPEFEAKINSNVIEASCDAAFDQYESLLAAGVAKEVARAILPVGTFTKMWATVNPRNLLNFLVLRTAENAQKEIRAYAQRVEAEFAEVFPRTWTHWNESGRQML